MRGGAFERPFLVVVVMVVVAVIVMRGSCQPFTIFQPLKSPKKMPMKRRVM
ncbi:MAG: hypothetical protein QM756_31705 [Polyangiaceae bacterium]